ncbi:Chitin elicitor-binding protein [Platanthera zijinensis]|uniref:Chitin elicitor-binding protein n=1 Tax=Platanthera zijinensis TaxID=2320716 RepID=A0AAP0G477_9ASPA
MKSPSPFFLLISAFIYLSSPAAATPFLCATPETPTCQSLVGYIPPNRTTYAAIKSLFTVKSIRSLYSANNLPPFTSPLASIPAGATVRVPIPCACVGSSGSSSGRPIYYVKLGDGLDFIARNIFSGFVTYQEIAAANNISNPNLIEVGERLLIPLPCSCDAVDGTPTVHYAYLVAAGNSLASISEEFGVQQDSLLQINGIKDPKDLIAGQVLDVPLRACSSSISNSSLDRNLRVANGSYVLTAKNCVRCSCSSKSWQLDCQPTQGLSNSSCPVAKCGNLFLGNTSASACETSTCAYNGYTASNILASLTNQSTCNGTNGLGPVPSQDNGSALRMKVKGLNGTLLVVLQIALVTFGLLWSGIR